MAISRVYPFYWEEMAEFEFELNQSNLKFDYDLNFNDYKIYNSDLI
jgi:hypothetical protein